MEIIFLYEVIFEFISYLIGAILPKECCLMWGRGGVQTKYVKGGGHVRGGVCRKGEFERYVFMNNG